MGEFLQHTVLGVNFQLDVVGAAPPERLALIALGRDGSRTEISFGEVSDRSAPALPARSQPMACGTAMW